MSSQLTSVRENKGKWAAARQNQQNAFAPSEDSYQPVQSDQSFRCPHEESLGP